MANCLFVTWDGPSSNYLEALFLPIFVRLANEGYRFHVLQFTWGDSAQIASREAACRAASVPFKAVKVMRGDGILGPALSAVWGAKHVSSAVKRWGIEILMPRSILPALATLAMRNRSDLKIVFDADGLAADEKVDFAGLSPSSATYRIMRDIEAQMIRISDVVLTRTERAIPILVARAGAGTDSSKFFVVTNGRSAEPFLQSRETTANDGPTICYVGSIARQYYPNKMLELVSAIRRRSPRARFEVLTGDVEVMRKIVRSAGLDECDWISIQRVPAHDVNNRLSRADLGIAFREVSYSTQGVSPIKLGDYLLAGVPVVGAGDVGNTDQLISSGVLFPSDGTNIAEAADWFCDVVLPNRQRFAEICRCIGERQYTVEDSARTYLSGLQSLGN
jgi:glycosyltransferase involved in cell wall biosynthesis